MTTNDKLTAQEIFNTVRDKMRAQGEPAFEGSACRMRTTDGLRCAYGCLLTDEEVETMPNFGVERLHEKGALPERFVPHIQLLKELQNAHDGAAFGYNFEGMDSTKWIDRFEASLVKIANRFNLTL